MATQENKTEKQIEDETNQHGEPEAPMPTYDTEDSKFRSSNEFDVIEETVDQKAGVPETEEHVVRAPKTAQELQKDQDIYAYNAEQDRLQRDMASQGDREDSRPLAKKSAKKEASSKK